jgi:hypothetical protein
MEQTLGFKSQHLSAVAGTLKSSMDQAFGMKLPSASVLAMLFGFMGHFPCGHWPDIKIFRDALINELDEGEKVEADKGYRGEPESVSVPNHNVFLNRVGRRQKELVRARHETLNRRLKQWHCLHDTFRHDLVKHGPVFRAVAVIVQVTIETGEPMFRVEYNDNQHY